MIRSNVNIFLHFSYLNTDYCFYFIQINIAITFYKNLRKLKNPFGGPTIPGGPKRTGFSHYNWNINIAGASRHWCINIKKDINNNIGIVITFLSDFYECLINSWCTCSFHCFIMAFYCSNMDISNLSIFCCLFGNCSLVHSGHITDCINNACCIFEIYTTYCQTFQSCSNIGHILFCLYWSFVQCFWANNFTFKMH